MYHRGIPGMVWLFILGCFWSLANYGHLQFCHHTLTINGIQSCMALMIFLAAFGGHVSTLPPALPPGRGFQRVLDPQTPIFPPAAGTSPLLCPPGPLYSLYWLYWHKNHQWCMVKKSKSLWNTRISSHPCLSPPPPPPPSGKLFRLFTKNSPVDVCGTAIIIVRGWVSYGCFQGLLGCRFHTGCMILFRRNIIANVNFGDPNYQECACAILLTKFAYFSFEMDDYYCAQLEKNNSAELTNTQFWSTDLLSEGGLTYQITKKFLFYSWW